MKIRYTLPLLLLAFTAAAQTKMLTVEDAVLRQRSTLAPQRLDQLNWIGSSDSYYYIDKSGDDPQLMSGSPGGEKKTILKLTELQAAVAALNLPKPVELKAFPQLKFKTAGSFTFSAGEYDFTCSAADKKVSFTPSDKDMEHADEAPATGHIAFTRKNNLYVTADGKTNAVTSDPDANIVNGQSVHRDEFGISKGTFWSPSGKKLAFYRMDQRMVTDYPIMDLSKQPAAVNTIKYPMAGGKSHEVTIGIYDTENNKTIFLKTGEPKDQYLTNICWGPDERSIYVVIVNRGQDNLSLQRFNAATGEFEKKLIEENDDQYVHPMHPMVFVPGSNQFIWRSERECPANAQGRDALYLCDADGREIRPLTPTRDECPTCAAPITVTDFYGFGSDGKTIYLQATTDGSDRNIYSIGIDQEPTKENFRMLSSGTGVHQAIFNSSCSYFIDNYSSTTVPRIQQIVSTAGKATEVLLTATNPLKEYKACAVKLFTIKAADNTTPLWCRMITPPGFNAAQKYPALVYVYNGPNVQLVTNSWLGGADLFLYYMAQQGYVVFTVDGRGSANRSLKFEQATFAKLGTVEIDDQEKGVEYLKKQPFVNSKRIAVYGWSYGGFMTTSLMTRKPGLFTTGVAGGPVIDWSYYEVMYTERYMNTPQENKEGYEQASLLNHVDRLKGKLLLIHGTSDDVVVWQHSLLYLQKAVEKGVLVDYFVYPGHPHNVMGKDRVHLMQKIADYILTNNK